MYIPTGGQSHSAWAATEVLLDHHCPHCRAVSQGVVLGRGSGGSGGFDASASEAAAHARQNSQIDAARAMRLVRCPKCNRRDAKEVRAFFLRSLVLGLGLGAFVGALTFGAGGLVVSIAVAVLCAGSTVGWFFWKVAQSDHVVHFDPHEVT
jgi:hypothetical protein